MLYQVKNIFKGFGFFFTSSAWSTFFTRFLNGYTKKIFLFKKLNFIHKFYSKLKNRTIETYRAHDCLTHEIRTNDPFEHMEFEYMILSNR